MVQWKHAALLALALAVVGCSSNSKKELPPAELTDFKEEVVLSKQWSRSVGDGQGDLYNLLEPAVDGSTIYAASAEGRVMAIQRETGDVLWKKDLERPVSGGVGVGYGLVLVGTLRGDVIALDEATGKKKWTKRVNSEVLSAPATNGDVVVVQTQDDKLIGLDAASGDQRWIYESTVPVLTLRGTGAPLIAGNMALAGLASGKVVAVDVQRGLPIWEQRVAIPQGRSELDRVVDIDGGLLLSGDTLYVVSYQGRAAALDVNSGRLLWQREASRLRRRRRRLRQYLRQPGQRFGGRPGFARRFFAVEQRRPGASPTVGSGGVLQQRGGRRPGRLRASAEPGGRSLRRSRAGRQRWRAGSSAGGRELDVRVRQRWQARRLHHPLDWVSSVRPLPSDVSGLCVF